MWLKEERERSEERRWELEAKNLILSIEKYLERAKNSDENEKLILRLEFLHDWLFHFLVWHLRERDLEWEKKNEVDIFIKLTELLGRLTDRIFLSKEKAFELRQLTEKAKGESWGYRWTIQLTHDGKIQLIDHFDVEGNQAKVYDVVDTGKRINIEERGEIVNEEVKKEIESNDKEEKQTENT